jgi:Flp pilus assembly protein TadB
LGDYAREQAIGGAGLPRPLENKERDIVAAGLLAWSMLTVLRQLPTRTADQPTDEAPARCCDAFLRVQLQNRLLAKCPRKVGPVCAVTADRCAAGQREDKNMLVDALVALLITAIAVLLGLTVHPLLFFLIALAVLYLFVRSPRSSRRPRTRTY